MKTSRQFEEAFILMSTLKQMKYNLTESNKRLFTIECYTRGYDSKNTWVHKRHKHLSSLQRSQLYISTKQWFGKVNAIWLCENIENLHIFSIGQNVDEEITYHVKEGAITFYWKTQACEAFWRLMILGNDRTITWMLSNVLSMRLKWKG